jgi:hypothetical protein
MAIARRPLTLIPEVSFLTLRKPNFRLIDPQPANRQDQVVELDQFESRIRFCCVASASARNGYWTVPDNAAGCNTSRPCCDKYRHPFRSFAGESVHPTAFVAGAVLRVVAENDSRTKE